MAIDFSPLERSRFDPLEVLRSYGTAQQQAVAQRQQQNRLAAGQQFAAGNDRAASATLLGGGDFDGARVVAALSKEQRELALQRSKAQAGVAYSIKSQPPEMRAQAFQALGPQLKQYGFSDDEIRQAGADLSDTALDAHIKTGTDYTKLLEKQLEAQTKAAEPYTLSPGARRFVGDKLVAENPAAPDYQSIPAGGMLVRVDGGGVTPAYGGGATPQGVAPAQAAPGGSGAPISVRLNNPGAMRPTGDNWQGMVGQEGGFIKFDTPENGRRALLINIANQQRLHGIDTLGEFFQKYAPSSDGNDPRGYAAIVAGKLGVAPGAPVDFTNPQVANAVADAIAGVEAGGSPAPRQPQQQARRDVIMGPPKEREAPSGYRWNGSNLEAIPGGPGDKSREGGDTGQVRKDTVARRKEFDSQPEVKAFKGARQAFRQIEAIAARPSASNDIALIFNFMKTLDPGSTVREGEFATAQNAAGVPEQIRNQFNKAKTGERLNPQQRTQFVNTAREAYLSSRRLYNETAERYQSYARQEGLNPRSVAPRAIPQGAASTSSNAPRKIGQFTVTRIR